MLEGAVARILNQLLGKYVVDLDTENLNVGIFSGHVQLTDLKLKIEALYELKLPIKVSAGTIGKVQLQIPWSSLWSQPVIVNIEDVHIIANPIVGSEKFDADSNKRLLRAFKRKILTDLSTDTDLIGGPGSFSEYLVTNVINNLQLNISNVHLRYEDDSVDNPLVAGFCIGSITAEATNGKWKASMQPTKNVPTSYYLIKMEAFSIYCNPKTKIKKWNLPAQYYEWRNSMSGSLQNYNMHGEDFQFLIRPMTTKIKITINRNKQGRIDKLSSEIVVHDFNVLLTKEQSYVIRSIYDKVTRMFISWEFLEFRPDVDLPGNAKLWWKYAYQAVLRQRIKPYTWNAIKLVRENQSIYTDTYKKVLLNPNDTELKLDLQKYEDKLSIFNIVIARQQARLEVLASSLSEKSFWDILPTPERQALCEKIGFQEKCKDVIEYCYNFRVGNTNVTLINNNREILVLTMTQMIASYQPNFVQSTYKVNLKIEGIILEGASQEEHLVPILSSDHNGYNSPAYFLKLEVEKNFNENVTYRVNFVLEYLELVYHKYAFDEIQNYFQKELCLENGLKASKNYFSKIYYFMRQKLLCNWEINLDIKLPFLVLPENGSIVSCENILIVDLGQIKLRTELTETNETPESVTQMELEELMYSRYRFDCFGAQILFCNNGDTWHESRKEKDTDLHVLSKTSFNATYAVCIKNIRTLPKHKINLNFPALKLNLSERNLSRFLKFLNTFEGGPNNFKSTNKVPIFKKDQVIGRLSTNYLLHVQKSIILFDTFIRNKRNKDKSLLLSTKKKKSTETHQNENMNEVWARCVDLPGLEDNISPNNTINNILRIVVNEIIFSRSSDSTDRQYLSLRLGLFTTDIAWMTYGPAYQLSLGSIILTDKLHTTSSGQYLDLIYSPFPSTVDVLTILYRKVAANCPDFWTHFHGVETSLVADFGTVHIMFHQEAFHTIIMYTNYMKQKLLKRISNKMIYNYTKIFDFAKTLFPDKVKDTPVPPGSVKFSHSARLENVNVRICDSDFDIVNLHISGLELDFLFRANERFVLRAFLSKINVEHLSDITLYPKILYTDEDKVFDFKYVRYSSSLKKIDELSPSVEELNSNGSFKFHLGQLHVVFLYKLVVQLHRFMINLEAMPYLHKFYESLKKMASTATDNLMSNSKINLAINIKGPVLLIPQKSSSPNVIIVDTGDLIVENFFKEYQNEVIENILVKLNDITMLRGIMTLTSTLEMQETIIEPINLSLDIKRFISLNKSSYYKSLQWDIDGVMDTIPITLGQKDLGIILSVYSDNIGEGELLDLFPIIANTPLSNGDVDQTVKNLEAFFCEPKQKDISVKFNFESLKLALFFDSGELLSSPIRDLNHGLCKFEVNDLVASFIVYTDKSIDGKLSVTSLAIEEIGPDANAYHKGILQSPCDESKNNNCNITVNKPPIIDITFHQNKTSDKSIDMIIGRLALSLSIPFCEKLAMFIIECMPKENVDTGFINHGYIGELTGEKSENKPPSTSLTIALRVNKPEFIFFVETASKRKRYFITKAEILSDYSRHANCQNCVISLSGLQTLFCDIGLNSNDPYTILKQCDVELSKTFSDEKGTKITASISSIYVQFCNKVVYSINDILNDVIEHFKVPEDLPSKETRKLSNKQSVEVEDLWEATKINESSIKTEDPKFLKVSQHEIFLLPKTEIVVIFELEEVPVIVIRSTLELNIYDWSSLLNSTCELTLQANYFNETNQTWEPIVDPVVLDENIYKPWEVFIKVFQDKAQVILSIDGKIKKEKVKKRSVSQSTTEDEDESCDDMIYLKPTNNYHNRNNRRVKTSLSTFLDDSDSENEDGSMEKLAAAISDLFTGDWNESDGSECEQSSDGDDDSEDISKIKSQDQSLLSEIADYKKATFVLIDAKDVLHLTITPAFLKVLHDVFTMYSNKTISIVPYKKSIILINDIGPKSKVELFECTEEYAESKLIVSKTYEKEDSCPNSPTKYVDNFIDDTYDDNSMTDDQVRQDVELGYDFETINSLEFSMKTTPELYKKEDNKQILKIHVPGFKELHTGCPKIAMHKLMHLQSINSPQTYYLVTKCLVNKYGRTVVLSSPLQIKNETCFALSILYQPSVLQQLNLEPIGDVTNPFETTMRIAVLEPHEQYNVPLYIAYHCKLFIQPAYAEGHYASNKGIWWRDLVTDLDTAHNFHCNPKSNSNLEVFSLRVLLRKNVDVQNSHAHSIPNYIIHLLPPLILYNFLPYTITVENRELNQQMKVEPGEKTSIYSLNLSVDQKMVIKMSYNSYNWGGNLTFTPHLDEKVIVLSSESNNISRQLAINVKAERDDSCNVYFYTPYWIVNKTGLPLQIKSSSTSTIYAADNEEIILFTYKRHGKQTLQLKVYDSDWSNEFGLDCAGTTGLVVCKDNERKKRYPFLLSIKLTEICPRLTQLIRLLPSFIVANNTNRKLRFMEHNEKTDLWIDLAPKQHTPFWPETSSMKIYVKFRDSKIISQSFFISTHHHTVLRMDKGTAIVVNVSGGRTEPFKITFEDYKSGDAPVYVKNMCADIFLKIQQQDQSPVSLLSPFNALMYTWDDPTKSRNLIWNVYNNKGPGFAVDIHKEGYGEERVNFHSVSSQNNSNIITVSSSEDSDSSDSIKTALNNKVRRDKIIIYWIVYREGKQKTLLFTQDQRIFNGVLQNTFGETCDFECLVSLAGVGLSCFTTISNKKEHIYVSINDSPAIWEVNVGHKWKTLTLELASWIEDKYKLHYKKCQLKDYIHIDFEKMFLLKPFFAELRRTYNPAFYAHLRKSLIHKSLDLKIQSIQIDNNFTDSNESVLLYPLPTDNIKTIPPFIEITLIKSNTLDFDIYKNISVLIRDFYVNMQNDLLVQLSHLLAENRKPSETTVLYRNDMNFIHAPIFNFSKDETSQTIVENVYLSQTLIQLNISSKTQSTGNHLIYPINNLVCCFFPHNISPYMPIEGVRHKITPLDMTDLRLNFFEVINEMKNHFTIQLLQQYYAQVLGLQVLINPFTFHAVSNEKPGNVSEKISSTVLYGCRCLLGHVNMSSIALEQSVIEVFSNQNIENIQRIRRHGSYHNASSLPKSVLNSAKRFNPGVILAMQQIIARSQSACLQFDGELFFRGTGKALVSLLTRHPDEKTDCVQVSIEALKRAVILGEPIKIHQRLARYCNGYLGLRPYSSYESMGFYLLETVANGRFFKNNYWAHAAIDKQGKSIIIISLENVIRVNKCRLWGPWELEWCLDLDDIISVPKVTTSLLIFNLRQNDSEILNSDGKLNIAGDKEVLDWLQEKIQQAIVVSMEDKSWNPNKNV